MARPSLVKADLAQRAREQARRAKAFRPAVPYCCVCGFIPAPYGFGDYSDGRAGALYACADPGCRDECEARVYSTETGRAA